MAIGSHRGAKAVRKYKPQGISSHRVVEHVGISTHRGFVSAGDLLPQGIYYRRGMDPIGEWIL